MSQSTAVIQKLKCYGTTINSLYMPRLKSLSGCSEDTRDLVKLIHILSMQASSCSVACVYLQRCSAEV